MTAATEGTVGVSIVAGHIYATDLPPTRIGQQVFMGSGANFAFHITPETAEQWIGVLKTIKKEPTNEHP